MGWDINLTPKRPPEWWLRMYTQEPTPPKKPRARQMANGSWWIHSSDFRRPFVVAPTLQEAWAHWLQLRERGLA